MTQRVFDVDNEKDMQDLWDILPDEIKKIKKANNLCDSDVLYAIDGGLYSSLFKINWHDKTEITRPIQEATEQDVGKLCYFWNDDDDFYAKLDSIFNGKFGKYYCLGNGHSFSHCRRLTKQEIEELI